MFQKLTIVLALVVFASGCATSFQGDANVSGPSECYQKCNAGQMDFAGMIYMGQYTSGCICRARGGTPGVVSSAPTSGGQEIGELALGAAPAAVGVVLQMRRNQAHHP